MDIARKPAQEVEIDHLLAEEFACDPGFLRRFLGLVGIDCPLGARVAEVVPEPSLAGDGFGDLLVRVRLDGGAMVLLIENKITAAAGVRQAERYRAFARHLQDEQGNAVHTVLVAPAAYGGERDLYEGTTTLEAVADILRAERPARLDWRRAILTRAARKGRSSGVQVPDARLHAMKAEYLAQLPLLLGQRGVVATVPPLKEVYYNGDSRITPIRVAGWPNGVFFRHRWWTSVKSDEGQVDLIFAQADDDRRRVLNRAVRDGACGDDWRVARYSEGKGVQLCHAVPMMRQDTGVRSSMMDRVADLIRDAMDLAEAQGWVDRDG